MQMMILDQEGPGKRRQGEYELAPGRPESVVPLPTAMRS